MKRNTKQSIIPPIRLLRSSRVIAFLALLGAVLVLCVFFETVAPTDLASATTNSKAVSDLSLSSASKSSLPLPCAAASRNDAYSWLPEEVHYANITDSDIHSRRKEWMLWLDHDFPSLPKYGSTKSTFDISGRGIVTAYSSSEQLRLLLPAFLTLLTKKGSKLPIEIWSFEGEIKSDDVNYVKVLFPLVKMHFRIADSILNYLPLSRGKDRKGFHIKVAALMNTKFEQLLFLDSDVLPMLNPDELFETQEFKKYGTIFWPDFWKTRRDNPVWRWMGVPCLDEWEQESGVILMDRSRVWKALHLFWFVNRNEEIRTWHERFLFGDKDLFRFTWRVTDTPTFVVPHYLSPMGFKLKNGLFCGFGMVQYDPSGRAAFAHATVFKLSNKKSIFSENYGPFDLVRQYLPLESSQIPVGPKPGTQLMWGHTIGAKAKIITPADHWCFDYAESVEEISRQSKLVRIDELAPSFSSDIYSALVKPWADFDTTMYPPSPEKKKGYDSETSTSSKIASSLTKTSNPIIVSNIGSTSSSALATSSSKASQTIESEYQSLRPVIPISTNKRMIPKIPFENSPSIVSFHRIDQKNVGDMNSSPFRYFNDITNTFSTYYVDAFNNNFTKEFSSQNSTVPVIVGGGGLIGCIQTWDENQAKLISMSKYAIGWGVGFNISPGSKTYNGSNISFVDKFRLLGVRDLNTPYRFVPCVSAMHPKFTSLRSINPTRRIGFFVHQFFPIEIYNVTTIEVKSINSTQVIKKKYSRKVKYLFGDWKKDKDVNAMCNDNMDMNDVLEFIASCEILITSSYHGLYWATLMNRKAILTTGFSTKFDKFPWPPIKYPSNPKKSDNIEEYILQAQSYPESLEQAQKANLEFWEEVKVLLKMSLKETGHYQD
ncbi:hypothetical protein HK096_009478 [Nowakowskiella sp. JEL0078]|nr:hypothetical protein HK096_009478 [Nowakowskiella sp. JEL0078]